MPDTITREAVTKLARASGFGLWKRGYRPSCFRGQHFITNELIAFFSKDFLRVEVSKGEFLGEPIYGFTAAFSAGRAIPDITGACFTLDDIKGKFEELAEFAKSVLP